VTGFVREQANASCISKHFSETSRLTSITAGLQVGATGKALTNVVSVGIGDIAFLALYLCILHSRQVNYLSSSLLGSLEFYVF
jgi:hypothetical protein